MNPGLAQYTKLQLDVHPKESLIKTIAMMNYLEQLSFDNATFVAWVYRQFASNCLPCIPGKIWNYVQTHFNYKKDSPEDEVLLAPYILVDHLEGDCDDFSLFIKTCLDLIGGWNTKYILFAKEKNDWSHIAVFAYRGLQGRYYIDPLIVDGVSNKFNVYPYMYNFNKIV